MTSCPLTIGRAESLAAAHRIMRAHRIRHLPVMDQETLVGIVSLRDLHLIETLADVDPEMVLVEDAMIEEPYRVSPDTPLEEVARQMAEHRSSSAIVVDETGGVVGMFTTVDALAALAAVLSQAS